MDVFGRTGITPGQWLKGQHGKGLAYDREIARRMAGGKTIRVFVTGDAQVDAALRTLEKKILNKTVRTALRKSGKLAHAAYISKVPVASGSMRDATKVRAMKKTRRQRGMIGISLIILRDKLFALYKSRTGKEPGKRKADSEPFFYPTVIEFGDKDTPAEKPLREAVYGNQALITSYFLSELRRDLKIP